MRSQRVGHDRSDLARAYICLYNFTVYVGIHIQYTVLYIFKCVQYHTVAFPATLFTVSYPY